MTQQHDSKGELRAAFTMRELENAKRSSHTGATSVFIRVTLAIIFMYLNVISYLMLDITGPVFVSILFLVAFFVPSIHQMLKHFLEQRRARRKGRLVGEEARLES